MQTSQHPLTGFQYDANLVDRFRKLHERALYFVLVKGFPQTNQFLVYCFSLPLFQSNIVQWRNVLSSGDRQNVEFVIQYQTVITGAKGENKTLVETCNNRGTRGGSVS